MYEADTIVEAAMKTTLDLLAEHPFLGDLPRPWLERLSFQAHPAVRHTGHRLFHENHPAERFWLLRSGRVALDFHVPGRGDVVIDTIGAGSVVGWSWLFPPYRWHFGAVAAEQTAVIEFNATGVRRLLNDDHEFGHELTSRFMSVVMDRLQATRLRLLDLYVGSGSTA
ncbi:MAG TPA: Crp/Fnr family transcriptional regulator [Pilimelia sp.]|nr:Crp/Fnr family transcriptional regulator [Pilimelia sp.]